MMSSTTTKALWWVKRDFRLIDNEALVRAIEQFDEVLAIFIIEPGLCKAPETSALHYYAWYQAAKALQANLANRGGKLIIRVGEAPQVLNKLRKDYAFDAIFSHEETGSQITFQRDLKVGSWCQQQSVAWHEFTQNAVIRRLKSRDNRMPIAKARLIDTPCFLEPTSITCTATIDSENWPSFSDISDSPHDERIQVNKLQRISEADAHQTLDSFLRVRGYGYSGGISSPNSAFTAGSRLSTHLAWGTISLRFVFSALHERQQELKNQDDPNSGQWRKSMRAVESRLHWHDHFIQRLESAPDMETVALNPAYQALEYGPCDELLQAWCEGRTGIPIVDASIRCLAATGFLNFRMRAMLVTTACFGLAQPWRSVLEPLAALFLDYEPGIHISQVQMQAGVVGINTLRVYSPLKQLIDHDPQCVFVKQWIPELREFSSEDIHAYDSHRLGDYAEPITDIAENAKEMKARVYAIKQSDEGKLAAGQVLEQHGSKRPASKRAAKRTTKKTSKQTTKRTKTDKRTDSASSSQLGLDLGH